MFKKSVNCVSEPVKHLQVAIHQFEVDKSTLTAEASLWD